MRKDTYILAIETSCDETSAAVVVNGREVLSNIISSQIPIHQKFGGVVPEIASRHHVKQILPVIDMALEQAKIKLEQIDAIAVTYGPGLVGALLVGIAAAKGLAYSLNKPLIGVNHLQAHIFANFIEYKELEPPFISLVVSGGHTLLITVDDYNNFELLGKTLDDAAGEAFDKIARVMNLPYPGGPQIEKLALGGNKKAIDFPRAMKADKHNFSFSGLKSSAINYLHNTKQANMQLNDKDIAASFQAAVIDVLCDRAVTALKETGLKKLVLAGGVSANNQLRLEMQDHLVKMDAKLYYPPTLLCTDNAAMIGCRAYYMFKEDKFSALNLNAVPSLSLVCN